MARKRYTIDNLPPKVLLDCSNEPDMCDQSFKDDCDINHIIASHDIVKYVRPEGAFVDAALIGDFSSVMDRVDRAKSDFLGLPSDIRSRFGNDARAFYDWMADDGNKDEALKLGLIRKVEPERSLADQIVDAFKRVNVSETAEAAKTE